MAALNPIVFVLFGVFLLVVGAVLKGLHIGWLLDPFASLMIFGSLAGYALMAYPPDLLRLCMRTVLTRAVPAPADCLRARDVFRDLAEVALLAAVLALALSFIGALDNLTDGAAFVVGMTSGIVAFLYGCGVALLVALPGEAAAVDKLGSLPTAEGAGSQAANESPAAGRKIAGLLVVIAGWVAAVTLLHGRGASLVNPASMIFMIAGLSAVSLIGRANGSWQPGKSARWLGKAALISGTMGLATSLLAILLNLRTPEKLFPGVAASTTMLVFALAVYFLARPFYWRELRTESGTGPGVWFIIAFVVWLLTGLTVVVMIR